MLGDEVRMLYAGAVNYADAAQLVLAHEASRGRDGLILPTHTLMGIAIELLFKAVYLHRGGDETRLRRPEIRHDLFALQRLASEQGFNSSLAQISEIIDIIGNNYARHEYRYMRSTRHFDLSVALLLSLRYKLL